MSPTPEERIMELEIKVAYQEKRIAELDDTVVQQTRLIREMETILTAVRAALLRLRQESRGEPIRGVYPEDDPVPHSG
ncbi:MAG: SlyX family protein [Myxococcota bacterium]